MKDMHSLVKLLKDMDDCRELDDSLVSYVNIDISRPNLEVIKFLLDSECEYLVSDYIDNKYGYVYADLDKFRDGQNVINGLVLGIRDDFSKLEIAKYLYIRLAKVVNFDINVIESKCDIYNFSMINRVNNIWESISLGKVNNVSVVKLYLYLCSLWGIDCEIVSSNDYGYLVNKLDIDGKCLIVDITRDMAFVQAGFKTRYFDSYNDDRELDKKIGYITSDYNDNMIDMVMKRIDYFNNNFLYGILIGTSSIMDVSNIGSRELGIVYQDIFDKYCSNYNVSVNNLYINNELDKREHFILISYNNQHYGYNYNLNSFVRVDNRDLVDNINNNNIGIYRDEDIIINGYETLEEA